MTLKTIGSGARDYSLISSWNTAAPGTLTDVYEGDLYNDSDSFILTAETIISGSTSTASNYKLLTTGPGQSFKDDANKLTNPLKYDRAKGVGINTTTNDVSLIGLSENYARVSNLQFFRPTGGSTIQHCLALNNTGNMALNILAEDVSASATGVLIEGANGIVINSIVILRGAGRGGIIFDYPASGAGAFNCTVVQSTGVTAASWGVRTNSANAVLKNVAAFGPFATAPISGTFNASSDYNATDAGTATGGAHDIVNLTYSSQFQNVTDASRDFRTTTGGLNTKGTRDQTNTNDLDIVMQARSTTAPTIGAWEVTQGPPLGFGKITDNQSKRLYFLGTLGALTVSKAVVKRRGFFRSMLGAFWRK